MLDAAPVFVAPLPAPPADFTIARPPVPEPFRIRRSCSAGGDGDILVCGRRDDGRDRPAPLGLGPGMHAPDAGLPRGIDLAPNLRLGMITDQILRPDGFVDQRAMFVLRLRF